MLKIKFAEIVNRESSTETYRIEYLLFMLAECIRSNASIYAESSDGKLCDLWTLIGASIDKMKEALLILDNGRERITLRIGLKPDLGPGWYASLPADPWETGYLTIDGKKLLKIYF